MYTTIGAVTPENDLRHDLESIHICYNNTVIGTTVGITRAVQVSSSTVILRSMTTLDTRFSPGWPMLSFNLLMGVLGDWRCSASKASHLQEQVDRYDCNDMRAVWIWAGNIEVSPRRRCNALGALSKIGPERLLARAAGGLRSS